MSVNSIYWLANELLNGIYRSIVELLKANRNESY